MKLSVQCHYYHLKFYLLLKKNKEKKLIDQWSNFCAHKWGITPSKYKDIQAYYANLKPFLRYLLPLSQCHSLFKQFVKINLIICIIMVFKRPFKYCITYFSFCFGISVICAFSNTRRKNGLVPSGRAVNE